MSKYRIHVTEVDEETGYEIPFMEHTAETLCNGFVIIGEHGEKDEHDVSAETMFVAHGLSLLNIAVALSSTPVMKAAAKLVTKLDDSFTRDLAELLDQIKGDSNDAAD